MITNFWNWLYSSVNNAINCLNTMYNNTLLRPFFDLLLVVVAIGVIMKFIIHPLIGSGFGIGESDRARKEYEKNQPRNAWYRKVDE